MSTQDRIRGFITEELWNGSPAQLTGDYLLIDNRVLDSIGIFQVVTFLEDEYGVEIGDDELTPENFSSLDAIAKLVDEKSNG